MSSSGAVGICVVSAMTMAGWWCGCSKRVVLRPSRECGVSPFVCDRGVFLSLGVGVGHTCLDFRTKQPLVSTRKINTYLYLVSLYHLTRTP